MPSYLGLFVCFTIFSSSALVIQAFLHSLNVGQSQTNFFYEGPESKYFRLCEPQTAFLAYLCLFFIAL